MVGVLGAGGMAEVFLLRRRRPGGFEKFLALKRIRAGLEGDQYGTMFLDEARIVALLQHPNIVQVMDLGQDETGLWFLMEYVHGRSTSVLITRARERRARIPLACVLYIISSVSRALHYAHHGETSRGRLAVVHRDVSPGNILVGFDGIVKLADFGVARAQHRLVATDAGKFKGKFGYASPEQIRGEPLDGASDLFSLGIVMYELLTRKRLFARDNAMAAAHAVLEQPIPAPSTVVDGIPPSVDAIVAKLLSRELSQRYVNGADVARDLDAAAHEAGEIATRESMATFMTAMFTPEEIALICPDPTTVSAQVPSESPPPSTATPTPSPRRSRGIVVAALLVVGLGAAVAIGFGTATDGLDGPAATRPAANLDAADAPRVDAERPAIDMLAPPDTSPPIDAAETTTATAPPPTPKPRKADRPAKASKVPHPKPKQSDDGVLLQREW